jgi:hypothetical protein
MYVEIGSRRHPDSRLNTGRVDDAEWSESSNRRCGEHTAKQTERTRYIQVEGLALLFSLGCVMRFGRLCYDCCWQGAKNDME